LKEHQKLIKRREMEKRNYKIKLLNNSSLETSSFKVKEQSFSEAVSKAYVKRNKYDDFSAWRVIEVTEE